MHQVVSTAAGEPVRYGLMTEAQDHERREQHALLALWRLAASS
jgi:hypothetical protein